MDGENFKQQCTDLTQELNIQIPCRLAERIETYAKATGSSIGNVIIEALDSFLRNPQH